MASVRYHGILHDTPAHMMGNSFSHHATKELPEFLAGVCGASKKRERGHIPHPSSTLLLSLSAFLALLLEPVLH